MTGKASFLADIEKPAVKSVQEPVDEKQEKELANTENIFGHGGHDDSVWSYQRQYYVIRRSRKTARGAEPFDVCLIEKG
jgi:hypothetical protein